MALARVVDTLADAERLVNTEPAAAIALIGELRLDELPADDRARAHWIEGNAHRVRGRLAEARRALRAAVAVDGASDGVRHDVAVSMAAVLIADGEFDRAADLLDSTLEEVTDRRTRGRAMMQRAMLLHRAGALDAARSMYADAVADALATGDELGEMRTRNNWGLLEMYSGALDAADAQFEPALAVARRIGQDVPHGVITHNLGAVAARRGDPRRALALFDHARTVFEESQSSGYLGPLVVDIARNLSDLGLLDEARRAADEAVELLVDVPIERAEALLGAARARLLVGDVAGALDAAQAARRAFLQQRRDGWVPIADLVLLLARLEDGPPPPDAELIGTIDALEAHGWRAEAGIARVSGALALVRDGRLERAGELLAAMPAVPHHGPAAERAAAVTAAAFLAAARGEIARAKRLVTQGLAELAELEATLGALELRAYSHRHGAELAQLGVELAATHGGPRELLARLDVQRGVRAVGPSGRRRGDPRLDAALAELRTLVSARRDPGLGPGELQALAGRERLVERRIRELSRQAEPGAAGASSSVRELIDGLGGRDAVMFGECQGRLVAVTVIGGRCRRWSPSIGREALAELGDAVDFALHRLQRRPITEPSRQLAETTLRQCGEELDRALVPPSVRRRSAPLVVLPFDRMHGIAWSALPSLWDRPVAVAPSLSGWVAAAGRRSGRTPRRVLAVAGPRLDHADQEIQGIAAAYPSAVRLAGERATTEACLAELERADVAHFACHGSFRHDNALFSSLHLAGGDLTVYDLERCDRLPATVVLSACDVGRSAVLGGGALLGLATALMEFGVAGVVAPLTAVSDEGSVPMMVELHAALASGLEPAVALERARATSALGAAASFVCFGA